MRTATITIPITIVLAACTSRLGIEGDAHDDPSADADASDVADTGIDPDVDGTDACAPMDAMAYGPCAVILPGVLWNGEHCVGLGSGCGCEGDDCWAVYGSIEECVEARRACYEVGCEPQRVHDDMCIDCTDEMYLGSFWDGMECYELRGCACDGDGCEQAFASIYECEAVQAVCDSSLCLATEGTWYPGDPCGPCGHYECGLPPPEPCCDAGCDCGPGRSFAEAEGCVDDPACTVADLCMATGGTWYPEDPCGPCGHYRCGEPSMLPCCDAGCDCGPAHNFVEDEGCVIDPECGGTREEICTSTGGTWFPAEPCGPCGNYTCGEPSMDDCCDAGCDCGPLRVYDPSVGCVTSDDCINRSTGDHCTGSAGSSNCRPGLVCCDACGMWSCPACMIPCCEDSPVCMEDGCLVPPP